LEDLKTTFDNFPGSLQWPGTRHDLAQCKQTGNDPDLTPIVSLKHEPRISPTAMSSTASTTACMTGWYTETLEEIGPSPWQIPQHDVEFGGPGRPGERGLHEVRRQPPKQKERRPHQR
jgi:hypothetical protein